MAMARSQQPARRMAFPGRPALVRLVLAGIFSAALVGCQSSNVADVLDAGHETSEAASSAPDIETIGTGSVAIAMLLPREPRQTFAEYRDAAALAIRDLGADQVMLTVYGTDGSPTAAADRAVEAAAAGARLILGPVTVSEAQAVAAIGKAKRPPVLAFTTTAGKSADFFAFASDEVDSALEVVAYAADSGKKKLFAVLPTDYPEHAATRLKQGLAERGLELVGVASAGGDMGKHRPALAVAEAVLILGAAKPAESAAAIRATGALSAGTTFLGTFAWPQSEFGSAALDGALLAIFDQRSLGLVAERFKETYGRPLSSGAAYAYDAAALAAALLRTGGEGALSHTALTADTGFKGATGIFRLRADGSVERLFSIYRLSGSKLVLQDGAPEGF